MPVVFDANMLVWLFDDQVQRPPTDPGTGLPTTDCKARVEHLLTVLSGNKDQIVIPAPALAEALVHVPPAKQGQILSVLSRSRVMRVEPFGDVAAAECARIIRNRRAKGPLGNGTPGSRQLIKFDAQIVAIASVARASLIYSSDPDVKSLGTDIGRTVVPVWELNLPTTASQRSFLDETEAPTEPRYPGEF